MLKIVSIGGGTGLFTLLRGLKKYNCDITAVVSMADDGGSTGRLRDELGVLPPGDIRQCMVALSESSDIMRQVFSHRFKNGSLGGHSLGNLIITAAGEIYEDEVKGIKQVCKMLNIKGKILPVTSDNVRLAAELISKDVLRGETKIDEPKDPSGTRIKRLFLEPEPKLNQEVVDAILEADIVTLGPGSLYTSVISNLVVPGLPETILESKAKTIYISNLMTKAGESDNFSVEDYVEEVEKYLRKEVDYVIYNTQEVKDLELLYEYDQEGKKPVNLRSKAPSNYVGLNLISAPILVRHDSDKLAKAVVRLGILESLKDDTSCSRHNPNNVF